MDISSQNRAFFRLFDNLRINNLSFLVRYRNYITIISCLISLLGIFCFLPGGTLHSGFFFIILSVLAYAASHLFRAARLAIISSSLLKTSARTIFWLQLSVTPFTILPPLKAGELVLLFNIWIVSNNITESILTIIIDRLFDAIILCAFLFISFHYGYLRDITNSILLFTQWMILSVTLTSGLFLIIGPGALESLQRYIVINHLGPYVRPLLYAIDLFRTSITSGNALLLKKGAYLMMISLIIWGLEFLSTVFLTSFAIEPAFHNAGVLLISRAAREWHAATALHVDVSLKIAAKSSIVTILAIFPFAVFKYLTRLSLQHNALNGKQ